jgi:hypothetical protein
LWPVRTIYGVSRRPKRASWPLGYGPSRWRSHAHWECDVRRRRAIRTSGRVSDAAPR